MRCALCRAQFDRYLHKQIGDLCLNCAKVQFPNLPTGLPPPLARPVEQAEAPKPVETNIWNLQELTHEHLAEVVEQLLTCLGKRVVLVDGQIKLRDA